MNEDDGFAKRVGKRLKFMLTTPEGRARTGWYIYGVAVGAGTVYFFSRINTKHKLEGMQLENVMAKIMDRNFLVHLDFKDGCWNEYAWDIERLQQGALEAASQDKQAL
jgi:hypothetical protein